MRMNSIQRFAALLNCKTEKEWLNSVLRLGKSYGFEQTQIALSQGLPTTLSNVFLRGNFSSQWLELYDRKKYINIDPALAHCTSHSTPVLWRAKTFTSKKQKEMSKEAANFGLRSGISLPFHGANGELGILCLAKSELPNQHLYRDILRLTPELSMMRDYAFQAALRFAAPKISPSKPILTPRELECLRWCAAGKVSWEIAQILKCTEATINYHMLNICRKFNAPSRRQAVVNAIHCGLLSHTQPPLLCQQSRENCAEENEAISAK